MLMMSQTDVRESTTHAVPLGGDGTGLLCIDADSVGWHVRDQRRIRLDDIVSVAYRSRTQAVGPLGQEQLVREVHVHAPERSFAMTLGRQVLSEADLDQQAQAYYALTDVLFHQVEPRLIAEIIETVQQGLTPTIAGLTVTAEGLLLDNRGGPRSLVAWQRLPSAHFGNGEVTVTAGAVGGSARVTSVSMLEPNAVLIPELCEAAIAAFE